MQALVIDGRTRKLNAFVASVTQAQSDNPYQLVLRHALDMGHIQDILAPTEREDYLGGGETKTRKQFLAEMPVILMGEYSARSSAGHVAIHSTDSWDEARDGHRKVLIVGGLGKVFGGKGGLLKVLGNPIVATLVRGPVEIEEFVGAGNSNCASADAAWAGVKLLASTDRKSVFLVEGQSDYTYVVRLRSTATEGATEFPSEHREEMFSRENIVRRMVFSSAYHGLVRGRDDHDYKPSEDEVKAAAKRNMEAYLSAKSVGEERYSERLGRRFGSLNMSYDAIAKMAEELGANVAPVETATA